MNDAESDVELHPNGFAKQEGFRKDWEVEVDLPQVIIDRLSSLEREVSDLRHILHGLLEEERGAFGPDSAPLGA